VPDGTWIAACCLVHGLPLATFNMKDYTDFAEHEGLQILGHNDR
jgi:toxin FitB